MLRALTLARQRGQASAEGADFARALDRADAPPTTAAANRISSDGETLFQRMYELAAEVDARLIDVEHLEAALERRTLARSEPAAAPVGLDDLAIASVMDPRLVSDPYPIYRQWNALDAVHRDPVAPAWVVTGYDAAASVLRDPRFSSQPRSPRTASGTMEIDRLPEGPVRRQLCVIGNVLCNMTLFSDAPGHSRMRSAMSQMFSPRNVASLRPLVQQLADELIDDVSADGRMDFVEDFAFPLPLLVIADVMGMSRADKDELKRWSVAFASLLSFSTTVRQDLQARQAMIDMRTYFDRIVAKVRDNPNRSSLLAQMVFPPDGSTPMSEEELFGNWVLALAAGHETTTASLGSALWALLNRPEALRWLLESPEQRMPGAVEELLRFESPLQWTGRRAKEEIALAGQTIHKNMMVVVSLGAANRDPRQFTDPDRVDLSRANASSHLAFSTGSHFCMGAALARMELSIGLTTLFKRLLDIRLTPDFCPRWRAGTTWRSIESMPVTFAANE